MPHRPHLTSHAMAFVDLLGLRDRMASVGQDKGAASKLLTEYYGVMRAGLECLGKSEKQVLTHRCFSDSFVLATEVHHSEWESAIGHLIMIVAELQVELVQQGWFIRGGIAVGDYYETRRVVYGPALVEAHALEQSHAIYPRIVLSQQAVVAIGGFLKYYGDPFGSPENTTLLLDIDNEVFVNYLYSPIDMSEGDLDVAVDVARKHKEIVEAALGKYLIEPHLLTKYQWVARYHNFFVRKWLPDAKKKLLIPQGLVQVEPRLLVPRSSDGPATMHDG